MSLPVGRPGELEDHDVGDLLRRHQLHLAERGHGLELVAGEHAVLADVDVDALEVASRFRPAASVARERVGNAQWRLAVDELERAPARRTGP